MHTWLAAMRRLSSVPRRSSAKFVSAVLTFLALHAAVAFAQPAEAAKGEANLQLPDLSSVTFLGMDGHKLLTLGLIFCASRRNACSSLSSRSGPCPPRPQKLSLIQRPTRAK